MPSRETVVSYRIASSAVYHQPDSTATASPPHPLGMAIQFLESPFRLVILIRTTRQARPTENDRRLVRIDELFIDQGSANGDTLSRVRYRLPITLLMEEVRSTQGNRRCCVFVLLVVAPTPSTTTLAKL